MAPTPASLPFSTEQRALEAAARLDFAAVVDHLGAVVARLEGASVETARLFLYSLLVRLTALLERDASTAQLAQSRAMASLSEASDAASAGRNFLRLTEEILEPLRRAAGARPVVARAKWFIEENHARKLSLRDVSDFVNVSPNYLSSLFRRECAMTLTAYIHQVRLRQAEVLFLTGDKSLSEIAYLVGYQTYRDFYRNFVKHQRESPSRFRRALAGRAGPRSIQTSAG